MRSVKHSFIRSLQESKRIATLPLLGAQAGFYWSQHRRQLVHLDRQGWTLKMMGFPIGISEIPVVLFSGAGPLVFKSVMQCNTNTSNNNIFEQMIMRHLYKISTTFKLWNFYVKPPWLGSGHVAPLQLAVRTAKGRRQNSPDEHDECVQSFLIVVCWCLISHNKQLINHHLCIRMQHWTMKIFLLGVWELLSHALRMRLDRTIKYPNQISKSPSPCHKHRNIAGPGVSCFMAHGTSWDLQPKCLVMGCKFWSYWTSQVVATYIIPAPNN